MAESGWLPPSLVDKVALVTGAASGIGRASALAFATAGARVIVADVDAEGGEETVRHITAAGGEARFVRVDVTQEVDVAAMVAAAVDTYGRLDCAYNNAGIEGRLGPLQDLEVADWDRVLAVNLIGVWCCLKHEIVQMTTQGGGAIVNTASIAGLTGFPGAPAYCASKHAVIGLTKSAALAEAGAGIRVNAVCPGFVETAMVDRIFELEPDRKERTIRRHPIGRFGKPAEVAAAVVWLCSDAASFVTGAALTVDGGFLA